MVELPDFNKPVKYEVSITATVMYVGIPAVDDLLNPALSGKIGTEQEIISIEGRSVFEWETILRDEYNIGIHREQDGWIFHEEDRCPGGWVVFELHGDAVRSALAWAWNKQQELDLAADP